MKKKKKRMKKNDTYYSMDEPQNITPDTRKKPDTRGLFCNMIPFIRNIASKRIHRRQNGGGQWLGVRGNEERQLNGYKILFCRGENILEPERGGRGTML